MWRYQTLEMRSSTSEGREVLSGVEDLPLLQLRRLLLWDLPAPVLDDFMLLSSSISPLSPQLVFVVVLPMVYNFEGVPTSSSSQAVVVTALAITLEIESSEKIVLDFTNSQWFLSDLKKNHEINFTKNFVKGISQKIPLNHTNS